MTTLIDKLSALNARVGSIGLHGAVTVPTAPPHDEARAALRAARLALYCDHDAAALSALRTARHSLMRDPGAEAAALATLDEAAWHIRRHASEEAQQALARVDQRLA